jgi:hypothetical protein
MWYLIGDDGSDRLLSFGVKENEFIIVSNTHC